MSKLCQDLDISDDDSDFNQYENMPDDIENVTVRTLKPIIVSKKTSKISLLHGFKAHEHSSNVTPKSFMDAEDKPSQLSRALDEQKQKWSPNLKRPEISNILMQ